MATGAAVATVAAMAIKMSADAKAAKAEEAAAQASARAKHEQANELIARSEFNIEALKEDTAVFRSEQELAFAKQGFAIGVGSSLDALEETNRKMFDQIDIERREASFKAEMLRSGADVDLRLGSDIRKAERIGRVGTLIGTGANISNIDFQGRKKPKAAGEKSGSATLTEVK